MRIPLRDDPTRELTHDELVVQAVQYLEYRGWLVIQTHGPHNRPKQRGVTDLVACRPHKNLLVEIKTGDDQLRPDQLEFADRAIRRGLEIHVVRCFDDLVALVHRYEEE